MMNQGNDDLLFGQPNDLEEAVETLIEFYGEDRLRDILLDGSCLYDGKQLYGMAEFIRNHWFLWWHSNHNSNYFPASKSPLLSFFHDTGIASTINLMTSAKLWKACKPIGKNRAILMANQTSIAFEQIIAGC